MGAAAATESGCGFPPPHPGVQRHSAFFIVQLSHAYMTTGKTIALTRRTFVGKVMSLLFNMLSRLVIEEGNGTLLQYSCLENPMDRGAWRIFKSRDITLPTKVRLVKAMVFPVVMYGCESWTVKRLSAEELMLLNCGVGEDS